jgi:microcystin-dependent protein
MGKMNLLLAFLFIFIFSGISYAQDEEIILTTYYPAPYGEYDMLVLEPQNGPPSANPPNGAMYFDDGTDVSRERGIYIYDGGWVSGASRFGVPSGTIVMWSGSIADIPTGWVLCNGGNGTPDLRERFVVGAGGDNTDSSVTGGPYNPGDAGSNNHEVTLTIAQMPSHKHTGSTNSAGSHSHRYRTQYGSTTASGSNNQAATPLYHDSTTGSSGSHSHTMNLNNTGGNQAHENRPPYYALCFIMKL